jgi:hypothetical protein
MMQKLILTSALMLILATACKKQTPSPQSGAMDFAKHYSISPHFDKKSSTLTVTITLDKGLHAYADGEKIGKPVRLEIIAKDGWAANGLPTTPKGVTKKLDGLGESVILPGNFEVIQKVIEGQGAGEAKLYLQVCTDNACDQPREHKFPIRVGL